MGLASIRLPSRGLWAGWTQGPSLLKKSLTHVGGLRADLLGSHLILYNTTIRLHQSLLLRRRPVEFCGHHRGNLVEDLQATALVLKDNRGAVRQDIRRRHRHFVAAGVEHFRLDE